MRKGPVKDTLVYHGPGMDGHAKSVAEAWRKFTQDPLLMQQPRTTSTATAPAPSVPTAASPTSAAPPAPLQLSLPGKLNLKQATRLSNALKAAFRKRSDSNFLMDKWEIRVSRTTPLTSHANPRVWKVVSPDQVECATIPSLLTATGRKVEDFHFLPADSDATGLDLNARITMNWGGDWLQGTVRGKCLNNGTLLHQIVYDDDGKDYYQDLADPENEWRNLAAAPPTTSAGVLAAALAQAIEVREQRRQSQQHSQQQARYRRVAEIYSLLI